MIYIWYIFDIYIYKERVTKGNVKGNAYKIAVKNRFSPMRPSDRSSISLGYDVEIAAKKCRSSPIVACSWSNKTCNRIFRRRSAPRYTPLCFLALKKTYTTHTPTFLFSWFIFSLFSCLFERDARHIGSSVDTE